MLKNKEKGKKRKLYHFNQFIKDFTYYNFARFEFNGHKGYIYYLDGACEKDLCEIVKKYDNTERFIVTCQYAPEIRHHALFIAN